MPESLRFTITPKEELKSLLGESLLSEYLGLIWECDIERRGRTDWWMDEYIAKAKLVILGKIYEVRDSDPGLFHRLFDFPGSTSLDLFDRWWTLVPHRYQEFVSGDFNELDPTFFTFVPNTGNPKVDYHLDQMRKKTH